MKVLIITNLVKDKEFRYSKKVVEQLEAEKLNIYMDIQIQKSLGISKLWDKVTFIDIDKIISDVDIVISIGGDGTLIHVSKYAAIYGKPVFGINAGRLGFLTNLEYENLNEIKKLSQKKYKMQSRMTIDLVYKRNGLEKRYMAVNDVVITRGSLSRIIDIDIECEEIVVGKYRSDGIIFATPTGCTAYSLSAGGPIIEPTINCIAMTTICPHSLFARTILFSENKHLKVKPYINDETEVYITIDGEENIKIQKKDEITIAKGEREIKLIELEENKFYHDINKKFVTR